MRPLVFCLTLLALATPAVARDTVRLSTGEFAPFSGKDLPHQGIVLRIVKEAFASAGVDVQYTFLPWKRAYESAKEGAFDGSAYWGLTPDRLEHFHASESLFDDRWVFFHRKDAAFDWKALQDLRDQTIGGTLEYTYTPEFHALARAGTLDVQWVPTDEQNLRKLLLRRVKLVPLSLAAGYDLIDRVLTPAEAAQLTHHPRDFYAAQNYLLLSSSLWRK